MKSLINSKVTPERKYPGLYTNTAGYVYIMPDKYTAILVFSPTKGSPIGKIMKDADGFSHSNLVPFIGSITIFSGD